ncbi:MAG: FAD-dependent oxidoreductase, partial [Planctomycetota bacterium]|nr:FAD-dependent oxidoreductase [Planctomycetota bacterium]
ILVGPESRGSSPIRMPRDPESRVSTSTPGLYPMGEGAGFAGGIMSAALDGARSAQAVIEQYQCPNE